MEVTHTEVALVGAVRQREVPNSRPPLDQADAVALVVRVLLRLDAADEEDRALPAVQVEAALVVAEQPNRRTHRLATVTPKAPSMSDLVEKHSRLSLRESSAIVRRRYFRGAKGDEHRNCFSAILNNVKGS